MVSALSPQEFNNRLANIGRIASSNNRNLLLNDHLEVTEKGGIFWTIKGILRPICKLFGYDIFSNVRMSVVAQKFEEFLVANQHHYANTQELREGIRWIDGQIINPLKRRPKDHRFNTILNRTLAQLNNRLAQLERDDALQAAHQQAIQVLQAGQHQAIQQAVNAARQEERAEWQQEVQALQVGHNQAMLQAVNAARQEERAAHQLAVQALQVGHNQAMLQAINDARQEERAERQLEVQDLQNALRENQENFKLQRQAVELQQGTLELERADQLRQRDRLETQKHELQTGESQLILWQKELERREAVLTKDRIQLQAKERQLETDRANLRREQHELQAERIALRVEQRQEELELHEKDGDEVNLNQNFAEGLEQDSLGGGVDRVEMEREERITREVREMNTNLDNSSC